MNKNKVSIALCPYNGERFINTNIDSIFNQFYRDFELIINDENLKKFATLKIYRESFLRAMRTFEIRYLTKYLFKYIKCKYWEKS